MSFYTSLTGLNSASAQLGVTSNNIANVGTTGFKRSRADFGDIFATSPLQKASSTVGQGVALKQVSQEFSQGNVTFSSNALDLAITGDGFFPLKSADGLQDIYTRNGAFMLNEQFNVVNSAGQRLMAATVDSTGSANVNERVVLTIPQKTTGEASETSLIQLGVNFPADAQVVTEKFNRGNPATYNKSTALTVYDKGGNGYLATIYYVKTENASQGSPFSKWQTNFFVGDTQVKPALQQATNITGSTLYVNKYGDVLPKTDKSVKPSSGTTEMYTLDQQTDSRSSTAASVTGNAVGSTYYSNGVMKGFNAGDTLTFSINADNAASATAVTYTLKATDTDPEVLARNLEVRINNVLGTQATDPRYGLTVSFDPDAAKFTIASGTTGDTSSIAVTTSAGTTAGARAQNILGLAATQSTASSPDEALRGKESLPATLTGEVITINTTKAVNVTSSNQTFFVSVDSTAAPVTVPAGSYTMEKLADVLQTKINEIVDTDTGRQVLGVEVSFDSKTKQLKFSTGTKGDGSSIQVTGSSDWGLANTEMKFGQTTSWIKLTQYTENGALQYVKNGAQTEEAGDLSTKTTWWPVFLDRGELSFDLTGKPVSPLKAMPFETAFLAGGKGALTMSIDFTQSTQYSSAFAVLSQSQDGAPEGELMGLDIKSDGLVNATYSNGAQVSLGKIVLANFSSPTGLRQVGDASYLASATSGIAKIGEGGSAGFGSIRAGATERANVDLTQELVDLITAQRNFQANAKAIETSSTMTQAIINIRA